MRYEFALSRPSGKIRIKERLAFMDYGQPIAPTQTVITPSHYIEWQIGYDRVIERGEEMHFVGANGKNKQIYELSEFIKFGLDSGILSSEDIVNLKNKIARNGEFIDTTQNISREHFTPTTIAGVEFLKSRVSYPLLIHTFGDTNIICEIIVREKQRAIGIMPMLYFCIAMSCVASSSGACDFIGRQIASKECGYLEIGSQNIAIFVKMFEIFGLLSRAHQHDCVAILDYILTGHR